MFPFGLPFILNIVQLSWGKWFRSIILLFLHMRFGIYMTIADDNVVITQNFPNILHWYLNSNPPFLLEAQRHTKEKILKTVSFREKFWTNAQMKFVDVHELQKLAYLESFLASEISLYCCPHFKGEEVCLMKQNLIYFNVITLISYG